MSQSKQKVVQYLNEAHATETTLVSVLRSQIAMTPEGSYRAALEEHLQETHEHTRRVEARLSELGYARRPVQVILGFAETVIGHGVALSKTPLDLLRGTGGEEKVLKNAKDACATEALEIATYSALERLASEVGDERTATLASSIREDEQRMLDRVLKEIPQLAARVVRAEVDGNGSYDASKTGAAQAAGELAGQGKRMARKTEARAKSTARQTRKVPGVAQAEGQVKGAVADEDDLAIAGYNSLNADEIISKLSELSQIDLAKIDSYERRHDNRTTVLNRVASLRGEEPWPGYDELTVSEVERLLSEGDEKRAKATLAYERAHKNRSGVITAAERETTNA